MRESFIFYASFYKAFQEMSDSDRLIIYDALARYSLTGESTELVGIPKIAMILIKPQIDANQKRYEDGCKGAEHGKKGGRPRKNPENPTAVIAKKPQGIISETPNKNDNVNDNVNENENIVPSLEISVDQITKNTPPINIPHEISPKSLVPTSEIPIQRLYAQARNKDEPYAVQVVKT